MPVNSLLHTQQRKSQCVLKHGYLKPFLINQISAEWLNYQLTPIKSPAALVLTLLISTAGGRFPRAWLEPPCASHSGVSRLMLFPQMSSVGRVITDPGVAAFRSNQQGSASN